MVAAAEQADLDGKRAGEQVVPLVHQVDGGSDDEGAALDFYHRHERDLRLARARGQDDHAATAVLLPSGDAFGLVRVWLRRGVQLQGKGVIARGRILECGPVLFEVFDAFAIEVGLGTPVINARIPDKGRGRVWADVVAQEQGAFFKGQTHRHRLIARKRNDKLRPESGQGIINQGDMRYGYSPSGFGPRWCAASQRISSAKFGARGRRAEAGRPSDAQAKFPVQRKSPRLDPCRRHARCHRLSAQHAAAARGDRHCRRRQREVFGRGVCQFWL